MGKQELTTDTVERYIEASPEALYDVVADVTRTPERTPDILACEWLDGATGPAVGARFKARNTGGRLKWSNAPVVTAADPGVEFSFARSEPFGGTILWRHRFVPEGSGTRVIESYAVVRPIGRVGWFIIGTLAGLKDRRSELRASMAASLDRLAELVEAPVRT
jgi:ligand-binding SRPBCC domain-containing protein